MLHETARDPFPFRKFYKPSVSLVDDHKFDIVTSAQQGGKQIHTILKDYKLKVVSQINDNMFIEHAKKVNKGIKR